MTYERNRLQEQLASGHAPRAPCEQHLYDRGVAPHSGDPPGDTEAAAVVWAAGALQAEQRMTWAALGLEERLADERQEVGHLCIELLQQGNSERAEAHARE